MSHNISPSLTYVTPYDNLMDVPACMLSHLSLVQLFVTLSTVACQAPLENPMENPWDSPGRNIGVGCHGPPPG